jgi:hypothetical protein
MVANTYIDHLMDHLNNCKLRLSLLKDLNNKEMDLYNCFTKDIQDIYELTYGGPIEEA